MTELKPCPFCGKNPQGPYHDDLGTDDDYYVIRCPGCQLMMYDEYPDYVIKNWNRESERMTDLKPCPFCGMTDVKLNHYKVKENDWWYIACPDCQIAMDPWRWNDGQTREEAIKRWNRRVKE